MGNIRLYTLQAVQIAKMLHRHFESRQMSNLQIAPLFLHELQAVSYLSYVLAYLHALSAKFYERDIKMARSLVEMLVLFGLTRYNAVSFDQKACTVSPLFAKQS